MIHCESCKSDYDDGREFVRHCCFNPTCYAVNILGITLAKWQADVLEQWALKRIVNRSARDPE